MNFTTSVKYYRFQNLRKNVIGFRTTNIYFLFIYHLSINVFFQVQIFTSVVFIYLSLLKYFFNK